MLSPPLKTVVHPTINPTSLELPAMAVSTPAEACHMTSKTKLTTSYKYQRLSWWGLQSVGHLSLSHLARRRKVICSVWGAERAYTPHQVSSGHRKWAGHHSWCNQQYYYKPESSLCVNIIVHSLYNRYNNGVKLWLSYYRYLNMYPLRCHDIVYNTKLKGKH
jgi:hypothetical protein